MKIELTHEQVALIVAGAAAERAMALADPPTGLRPGQVVVDVGGKNDDEPEYTGTLNPDTLDRMDWAYYAQHRELWSREYTLFDRKPWIGNRATGELLHAGDLAGTVDTSGYYLAGSKFAPHL